MNTTTIGVVSDTHGLVRPEAIRALIGSDLIVHAGDVGDPAVLDALREVAPVRAVRAVRGNVDRGGLAAALPETEVVEAGGALLYVLHDLHALDIDPVAAEFQVVISGHSHRPHIEWREGVLYLNPGSIGPRRFSLPVAMARLTVSDGRPRAAIIELSA